MPIRSSCTDEIDKCGTGGSGGNPYAPLHILLERHSAATFQDVAFRMPANMSWVNWIATANDALAIPVSLLTRFRQIEVLSPTREQMRKVVQSIYASRRATVSNGDLFPPDLEPAVVERLTLSPRAKSGLCSKTPWVTPREIRMRGQSNSSSRRMTFFFQISLGDEASDFSKPNRQQKGVTMIAPVPSNTKKVIRTFLCGVQWVRRCQIPQIVWPT